MDKVVVEQESVVVKQQQVLVIGDKIVVDKVAKVVQLKSDVVGQVEVKVSEVKWKVDVRAEQSLKDDGGSLDSVVKSEVVKKVVVDVVVVQQKVEQVQKDVDKVVLDLLLNVEVKQQVVVDVKSEVDVKKEVVDEVQDKSLQGVAVHPGDKGVLQVAKASIDLIAIKHSDVTYNGVKGDVIMPDNTTEVSKPTQEVNQSCVKEGSQFSRASDISTVQVTVNADRVNNYDCYLAQPFLGENSVRGHDDLHDGRHMEEKNNHNVDTLDGKSDRKVGDQATVLRDHGYHIISTNLNSIAIGPGASQNGITTGAGGNIYS